MALVRCKECGNEISEHATTCVRCGYTKRPHAWANLAFKLLVTLVALIFVCMFGLSMLLAWVTRKPFEVHLDSLGPPSTSLPAQ